MSLAVVLLRWLVPSLSQRRPESVHVGFVVDRLALGQGFLRVLPFFPLVIISQELHIHIIWGINNKASEGSSSETKSRPIDINNTNECFSTFDLNLNSVNQLIFIMVKCGVLFEVRTEFLNNI
jgi:hypothetical protein